jgi:hypothetical protein
MKTITSVVDIDGDYDGDESHDQAYGTHASRSGLLSNTTNNSTTTNGIKRSKDISPCYVCGAKAHGYNFDQSNQSIRTRPSMNPYEYVTF